MVAIAAAVVVAFIGGLYFITHHKKEDSETLQSRQMTGNGLPPKPEERWRYIKELESRQPGVRAPTEPSAGGEVMNPNQLTDEQRQLLAQMQADMRQQPTQLTEVPWNEQTPEQRQQTLQRQRLAQQAQQAQQQQQWAQTQPVQQPRAQQQTQQPARQAQTTQQPPRQTQQPKAAAANQQPYQDLLQTPAHTTTSAPKQQAAAPVTRETTPPKATEKKTSAAGWYSVVRLKVQSRPKPCVHSWHLKGLIHASPPTTAGTASLSGLSKVKIMPTAPSTA